jgi:hypothetical protein
MLPRMVYIENLCNKLATMFELLQLVLVLLEALDEVLVILVQSK